MNNWNPVIKPSPLRNPYGLVYLAKSLGSLGKRIGPWGSKKLPLWEIPVFFPSDGCIKLVDKLPGKHHLTCVFCLNLES